jgi:prepilin-type N-terminal cleavage/methylation domain-containing protein
MVETKAKGGFTLLEVMVALAVAALALGWFLYVLSDSHYLQARARRQLARLDRSYGELLSLLEDFSPQDSPEGARVEALAEGGPFRVELRLAGVAWRFYYEPGTSWESSGLGPRGNVFQPKAKGPGALPFPFRR